jgi:hypothetical protein
MSNIITNVRFNKNDYLKMSNSATHVFIDVIILSGSSIAQNRWQKELIVFLSLNDQKVKGLGCVGFDVCELGWKVDTFDDQKRFLLNIIDNALKKKNWNVLNYEHKDYLIFANLKRFRGMINNYSKKFVDLKDVLKWNNDFRALELKKCDKHKVYMHPYGCKICHTNIIE